jgi:hypothetical protein
MQYKEECDVCGKSFYSRTQLDALEQQIGIPSNCFYWLHTHDESGIIHIEAPLHRDFTLGQFFDIWNKKLSNDQILNYVANTNDPLNVCINGTKVPDGTN